MSEEKKIKLDELPNSGSSNLDDVSITPNPLVKKAQDPLLPQVKKISDEEKRKLLSSSWTFDRPVYHFEWIIYIAVLLLLEYENFFSNIAETLRPKNQDDLEAIAFAISDIFLYIPFYLVSHPFIFALLTPFLFKFKSNSPFAFTIKFDGIETVKNLNLNNGSPDKVKIKWSEVKWIEKRIENKRSVLILHGHETRIGLLIWDINEIEKKSIVLILKGLIPPQHPIRIFIEKDIS